MAAAAHLGASIRRHRPVSRARCDGPVRGAASIDQVAGAGPEQFGAEDSRSPDRRRGFSPRNLPSVCMAAISARASAS